MTLAVKNLSILDAEGNIVEGATVTVRLDVVGEPVAELFSDRAGAVPLSNPFVCVDGHAQFFAVGGAYKITAVKDGYSRTWRYEPIGRAAETDIQLVTPRGEWASDIEYNMGDLVSHTGDAGVEPFISMVDGNIGNEPDADSPGDTSEWMHFPGATVSQAEQILADARDWATKTDGQVLETDYSSKAWAVGGAGVTETAARGPAKDWATKTDGNVDTVDASAKAWAIGGTGVTNTADRGAAKEWATKAEDSTVDGTGYSALHHAAKASAARTAAETAESNAEAARLAAENAQSAAENAQSYAENAQSYAEEWASAAEDTPVSEAAGGDGATTYSARHWATKAAASATDAETAETNAETAEANAEAARLAAENARDAALNAQAAAEFAADNFDDKYLGPHAADPTLDNDGDPLTEGLLYWNTASNTLKVYDGAAWQAYSAASGLTALVDDTAPTLGGPLDPNGQPVSDDLAVNGALDVVAASDPFGVSTEEEAAVRRVALFEGNRASPAANDSIYKAHFLKNDNNEMVEVVREGYESPAIDDGAEDGAKYLSVLAAGALTRAYNWTKAAFHAQTTNALTLGTAALAWLSAYVTTIYLGHATDTPLTRSAAGKLDVAGHTVLTDDEEDQGPITGGAGITPKNLGSIGTGTLSIDLRDRPMQRYTNAGAHTLDVSANAGTGVLLIENGSGAGAITTSGFTHVRGHSFTTTNGHKFRCTVEYWDASNHFLFVEAMQ